MNTAGDEGACGEFCKIREIAGDEAADGEFCKFQEVASNLQNALNPLVADTCQDAWLGIRPPRRPVPLVSRSTAARGNPRNCDCESAKPNINPVGNLYGRTR